MPEIRLEVKMDLLTERTNIKSQDIDQKSTIEILRLINQEDRIVAEAVGKELENIKMAVDCIVASFKKEGRLIYIGAGSSGRMGVLDAAESQPTFSVGVDKIVGLIAGGTEAMIRAIEEIEDDASAGRNDLKELKLTREDVVVGITASGNTPYVLGALEYANRVGARTVSLTSNRNSKINEIVDISITPVVGSEVITGSTRLKSGTAQKMVVNMLSTTSMIKMGKVYKNLMVDLNPTNNKLRNRARRIIMEVTGVGEKDAEKYLELANNRPKIAIVMIICNCDYETAVKRLKQAEGSIYRAIEMKG